MIVIDRVASLFGSEQSSSLREMTAWISWDPILRYPPNGPIRLLTIAFAIVLWIGIVRWR
jgi:hypothetical protein